MKTFKEHNVTAPTPVDDGAGGVHDISDPEVPRRLNICFFEDITNENGNQNLFWDTFVFACGLHDCCSECAFNLSNFF